MSPAGRPDLPLALTAGDPGGIGADVALMAWLRRTEAAVPPFYMISDPDFLAGRAARLGMTAPIARVEPGQAAAAFAGSLPVVALSSPLDETPGNQGPASAAGVIEAIDRAVADTRAGKAAAVVTGPIAKKSLYDAGFAFPGHTEYLAHLSGDGGPAPMPVMMLASPVLRAVPVTIHVPLIDVPKLLTVDLIVETARITARDLKRRFGIADPRIAISGLNPHAGESGTIGTEELTLITPAIEALRREGFNVLGPLPADTMFHAEARARYDAAICMYHDQALIPAKALAFDETVNVTLGLPFIRTSPDHGTAFELAGTGKARPDSMIAALKLAAFMAAQEQT